VDLAPYLPPFASSGEPLPAWHEFLDAIIGTIPFNVPRNAGHNVHRRLANSRGERKPHISYPCDDG
jgi:hypothetical protein